MDGPLQLIVYVAVKFLAYCTWCALGVRWLDPQGRSIVRSGLLFGFLRLLLGVVAGVSIFLLGGMMHWSAWNNLVLQYLTVYVPVRWFEWGLMELLIVRNQSHGPLLSLLAGGDAKSRLWRLGGIVVSHVADLPLILGGGGVHDMLPVGRFLC